MDSLLPPKLVSPERRRLNLFLKVVGIALLAIVLQVPLNMIRGVLSERKAYEAQAEAEIRATWGQQQLLAGPVLVVPYTVTRTWMRETKDADGKAKSVQERSVRSGNAYFLPEKLAVQATIDPEIRYRGIYEVAVYAARLAVSGEFSTVAGDAAVPNAVYDWSRATIGFGLTDARRLRAAPRLTLDGKASAVESSASGDPVLNLTARAPEAGPERTLAFTLDLDLQGSGSLLVVPVGKATTVDFKSAWANPSFVGAQLPAVRSVGPDGFKATWSLAHYGRGFPQAWSTDSSGVGDPLAKLADAGFGVLLSNPVTGYSMVDRALKYGLLFVVLVFAVFFLFEILAGLRVHPLQYALVGGALTLFFLGLLALSEFWPTGLAYLVSAATCTLMASIYAWSFLRTGWRTLIVGGGLGGTYAYLFFVLQSQDYALVAGTIGLFAMLMLVMFVTRRVDWYELDLTRTPNARQEPNRI